MLSKKTEAEILWDMLITFIARYDMWGCQDELRAIVSSRSDSRAYEAAINQFLAQLEHIYNQETKNG